MGEVPVTFVVWVRFKGRLTPVEMGTHGWWRDAQLERDMFREEAHVAEAWIEDAATGLRLERRPW